MQVRSKLPSLAAMALTVALAGAPARSDEAENGAVLAEAMQAASDSQWDKAAAISAGIDDPVAADLVQWTRLRHGVGTWAEYTSFLERNHDWPGLRTLRRASERFMPQDLPPDQVVAFYADVAPQTATGAMRLADALVIEGETARAEEEIVRAWRDLPMSDPELRAIRAEWTDAVAPHHTARLDMLLWRGMTRHAEAMLPMVDADWQALARARIMTRRDQNGLQAQIGAVPKALREHPGLSYERYLYRTTKGRWDDAEAYLLEKSVSVENLGNPEMWMPRRANLARQALRRGDVEAAYVLASRNFGSEGAAFADSEWVAGYIALIHMDEPERAVEHFARFQDVVATPISLGRAGYWLGRAHEAAGDEAEAAEAFELGAAHQTSFYGQLAAERAKLDPDPGIAGGDETLDWREAPFMDWSVVRAARLLHYADLDSRMSQFLRHAAEDCPPEGRAAIAQMAIDMGRPHIGIRIAKDAAREGIVLPEQYYPLHPIAEEDWPVPTEFALAIARQESELNAAAMSPVGARGLMQLMPRTAQSVARDEDVAFSQTKLTADSFYNARLGTAYLARLLDRYDGAYLLAAAAYNAGPSRVTAWIEANGDPRTPDVDPVIWAEQIPFSETRNYVMRVLEGLHVYRARLDGRAGPIRLATEMKRTG